MLEARLEKGLSFGTALVFLRWSVRGQRNRDAVLFSDSCGPDALRRLRVLLRAAEVSGQAQRGPASGEAQKGA